MIEPHASPRIEQEKDHLSARAAGWITGITVVVIIASCWWAKWLLDRGREEIGVSEAAVSTVPARAPAEIGLVDQTLIEHAFPGSRKIFEQHQRLGEYGWVDQKNGILHIPIDRAMDLVLREEGQR